MILSMTGYGAGHASSPNYQVTIELKSLNNKYFELMLKLPRLYLKYEHKIRSGLSKQLERGKVTAFINVEVLNSEKRSLNINTNLAKGYFEELEETRKTLGISTEIDIPFILSLPEVLPVDTAEPDPEEWELIQQAIGDASKRLTESRREEGKALEQDLNRRLAAITEALAEVERLAPDRITHVRDRIQSAMNDLKGRIDFDPNRFEQELTYYIEKLDINEEIVRLRQHLTYFEQIKAAKASSGKKLNFVAQEMGREINTIGSKAQNAEVQRHVVRMKDELDKIKEQVLNIV